jgi:multicomponent Na+:H+ antiporter subunit E
VSVGKFLVAFICLFLFWIGLTGSLDVQELVAGAIVAVFVATVSYELLIKGRVKDKFEPKRWGYAIAYFPAYVWAEIKSNLDVIYRIIHPKMPIKPGIVNVSTDLRTLALQVWPIRSP